MKLVAATLAIVLLAAGHAVHAQAPPGPVFEVASIKPSAPAAGDVMSPIPRMTAGRRASHDGEPSPAAPDPHRLRGAGLPDHRWPVRSPDRQVRHHRQGRGRHHPLEQGNDGHAALAAHRALQAADPHRVARELPIYALVLARGAGTLGPDLKPSTSDCVGKEAETQKRLAEVAQGGAAAALSLLSGPPIPCTMLPAARGPGAFGLRGNGQPIASLLQVLTQATGRTVVDKTGLAGLRLRVAVRRGGDAAPGRTVGRCGYRRRQSAALGEPGPDDGAPGAVGP